MGDSAAQEQSFLWHALLSRVPNVPNDNEWKVSFGYFVRHPFVPAFRGGTIT